VPHFCVWRYKVSTDCSDKNHNACSPGVIFWHIVDLAEADCLKTIRGKPYPLIGEMPRSFGRSPNRRIERPDDGHAKASTKTQPPFVASGGRKFHAFL